MKILRKNGSIHSESRFGLTIEFFICVYHEEAFVIHDDSGNLRYVHPIAQSRRLLGKNNVSHKYKYNKPLHLHLDQVTSYHWRQRIGKSFCVCWFISLQDGKLANQVLVIISGWLLGACQRIAAAICSPAWKIYMLHEHAMYAPGQRSSEQTSDHTMFLKNTSKLLIVAHKAFAQGVIAHAVRQRNIRLKESFHTLIGFLK